MIFSDFSFATSLGLILSQLAITSSVCCPSFGAGFNSGGLPSKRTGQVSHFQSPSGCFIVCMMPRSTKLSSFQSSRVSCTAPAGTPAAPMIFIASSLVWFLVHSVMISLMKPSLALRSSLVEARVADQLLAADHLEQAIPMLGIGAAAEDVDVVVIAARLGRVDATRCGCAGRALRAHARRTLLVAVLGHDGKRGADVVHDRVLHRELQAAAPAGLFFLVQRAENADAHQHAGAGVADRTTRLDGRLTRFAGDAHRAAGSLRDHVESEVLLVGAAFAKAFDLAIDDAGVDYL